MGVGASSDIVRKEMFSFEDAGGRELTLRPEGTAPICRARAVASAASSVRPLHSTTGTG